MGIKITKVMFWLGALVLPAIGVSAQIRLTHDYKNYSSAAIGTFQGINFREAGFSGLFAVPGTNGKEFWICSDRGVNVDAANANPSGCRPTYDKIYGFPNYSPKIFRVRVNGDSVQILQTISIKRPNGTGATGLLNPTGFGSKATEEGSSDTVLDCANYSSKLVAKDTFGIDAEGIVVDKDGNFWVCEEGGPTVWKISQNGVVLNRYTPYAGMAGAQPGDIAIDTVFKYRKNNRGFEGITITPNGKVYAMIQSPIQYPTSSVGDNSRIHRILEITPSTGATRMFAYINDGIIGASGSNQIRMRDWKIGDMAAINDTTFLVIEAALRGTSNFKRIYKISINGATPVTSGMYSSATLEGLVDSAGLAANSITPVSKTLFLDLLANGWDSTIEKAEGIALINDSTIAVGNDNDYGQYSPAENGIATATSQLSHVIFYNLRGANRLVNFQTPTTTLSSGISGVSSSQTPYLVPTIPGVSFTSIISVGDTTARGYKMVGIPDGTGAYDNNDGTFTLLVNHEFNNTVGATHAHGSIGSFVSKWVINKSNLSVVSGSDLFNSVALWNNATSTYVTYNAAFPSSLAAINRLCSADLPEVSAFYNSATGKGTTNRIFMNGEEAGAEGRAFGHILTGSDAGKTFELPYLGKFSWENSIASNIESDTTVVIGTDDATPGQVYVYVGTKTSTGNDIEKAGLTNGVLYGIAVSGLAAEVSGSVISAGTAFTLASLGDVHSMTGSALNTASNALSITNFLRPEDGQWDPSNPNDFYFATTNSFSSPSRLYRLRFTNAANPTLGGTITAVLDGTEGPKMMDNLTIDNYGHILIQEDPGNNAYIAKVWQYTIATDSLVLIGAHDSTRFLSSGANYLTQDEESSGIIDVERILGPGRFLLVDQTHYGISGDAVEGGQILSMFNPGTFNSAPEVMVSGNRLLIADGDMTPSVADNTNFGNVYTGSTQTKTFVIKNTGAGSLNINGVSFTGTNASEYTLATSITFPRAIASNDSLTVSVRFAPLGSGSRTAAIRLTNSDIDETIYDFAVVGNGVDSPEVVVTGNGVAIADGDMTPGIANNTVFGNSNLGTGLNKTYVVKNMGAGNLVISSVTLTGTAAADFAVVGSTYPDTVGMGDSALVTVRFTPSAIGTRMAVLTINSTDADEATYDFAIEGTGVGNPEINIQGNSVNIADGDVTAGTANNTDFGTVMTGSSVTRSFVIQNTGVGPLNVTSINFSGTHAGEFLLASGTTLPLNIAAGVSQSFSVVFSPSAVGLRTAMIAVTSNDADETTYDFQVQGTGAMTTGLQSINGISVINVYPNPGFDVANIAMELANNQHVVVTVLDLQGKEVLPTIEKDMQGGKQVIQLNTSSLQNGVYLLNISNGVTNTKTRLVIMH